jgi:uncharacterized protein with gpF-like domain
MTPILGDAVRSLYSQVVPTFAELTVDAFPKGMYGPLWMKQDDDTWQNAATSYVRQNGGTLISAPDAHTQKILTTAAREATEMGLSLGWGIPQIADEIRARSQVAISQARANRIARTEVIRASNLGAMTGARSTGLLLDKEWIATADDRTRDTHSAADQQIVHMEENFIVGGWPAMFPAAASLPAEESVNCRCTVAFIPRR